MVKGGQSDARANAQSFRARRRVRAHHRDRGTHAVITKMVFGEPDSVISGLVHNLDTLQRTLIHDRQGDPAFWPAEELEDSEFHILLSSLLSGHWLDTLAIDLEK